MIKASTRFSKERIAPSSAVLCPARTKLTICLLAMIDGEGSRRADEQPVAYPQKHPSKLAFLNSLPPLLQEMRDR